MRRCLAVLVVWVAATAACARPTPLAHTFDSPEALASAVLDAVARGDAGTLQALALSEAEFRDRVWPELPASRPERNLPLDYVWEDLSQKSRAHLRQTLAEHAGRRYRLVKVEFLGETTRYRTFAVARQAQLVVRDEGGMEQTLRLFGSVLQDEDYKLFSFVVD